MNVLTIKARSLARKLGVIRVINRLRSARSYEDRFHAALQQLIRPGDLVWDIGANVGLYSELFSQWVGRTGSVIAFEPVPSTFEELRARVGAFPSVHMECLALGSSPGTVDFIVSEYNPSSRVARPGEVAPSGCRVVPVQIATGDEVAERLGHVPNVMKIDVEGFEEDVLLGLERTLLAPQLRSVCVEVHFRQLEERGQPTAPVRMEKFLRDKGFRISWTDASHFTAVRPSAS